MSSRKQSKGTCAYCSKEMAKGGITKHLATCPQRQEAIAKLNRRKRSRNTLSSPSSRCFLQRDDNYGEPIPLVNSPRLSLCGYDGPAEPPYFKLFRFKTLLHQPLE
ncbi:hypothetical protein ACF3DV_03465 [Chlorogloeopsis fritschii PCC 9212]|uniref:hypothetical protein n=1 Tax=Chlorogloeopsis fritschii TaxID=1124 RepID=UPI000F8E608D|nr:hypothetical protein [Chlorogloeopsis fritschii]